MFLMFRQLRQEFEREYEGHTLQRVLKEEASGVFEKALTSLAAYTPPTGIKVTQGSTVIPIFESS